MGLRAAAFYLLHIAALVSTQACVLEFWKTGGYVEQAGSTGSDGSSGSGAGVSWDIRSSLPPNGLLVNQVTSNLNAGEICQGSRVAGMNGGAVCQKAGGTSISASNVLSGAQYWDASGNLVMGSMADQGSLGFDTPFPGPGYYSGAAAHPGVPPRICAGSSVVGVLGTAPCSAEAQPPSFAPRTATTDRASAWDENNDRARFFSLHSLVPNPINDVDGSHAAMVGRFGNARPGSCGSTGSLAARIAHCVAVNGALATYDGTARGANGEANWKLVAKSAGYEVWQDQRTGLVWSDRLSVTGNWYKAAGFASAATGAAYGDARPGVGQSNPPVSYCVESARLNNILFGPIVSDDDAGKTGLTEANSGIVWRLPTLSDWRAAQLNGMERVAPFTDVESYWTATSNADLPTKALSFSFGGGADAQQVYSNSRGTSLSVRCVGSAPTP